MSKMRAMQVTYPGGPFALVEREIPERAADTTTATASLIENWTDESEKRTWFLEEIAQDF